MGQKLSNISQENRIHAWLSRGYSITHLQAIPKFGCASLSSRIANIRRRIGYNKIKTDMVQHPQNKRCRFARYSMH